ncbi:MAG: RNA-binding protein [Porticoccaceae bacterium]|jgi:ribosome-associated heat shock protein Hsp15|nr:RNA-binding protein [Porticoccaceae bacterium]MBT4165262.1 RNA-binding protein [Porticoccaceae bacterium]MBT4210715.1 RNA-binding protein [Porticoccaceae bacterium]MBT4591641.1 RNA-binding protein [Porticoccaceae bacterium]MBT5003400.1 RNA-binding protein [Porticoccaceae bacterium]|tara:strand:+ start:1264 stop:1638 length:375 start_codon:yes stop_codon:yes gene_type:complete
MVKVRLDKWLWAARFFKTRALAKTAIDTGKIHIDGQKAKPSRMLEANNMLSIRQGDVEKTVCVITASEHRRGAPEAQLLYEETESSLEAREKKSAEQRAFHGSTPASTRPNKKQRRQIHRFIKI